MTVTIVHKHDMPKSDDEGECCCKDAPAEVKHDHTESLLDNLNGNVYSNSQIVPPVDGKIIVAEYYCEKSKRVFRFDDAPEFLRHNIYITDGYRGTLDVKTCLESMFWWTNETINIWSHLFGLMLFIGLTIYDLVLLQIHVSLSDKLIVGVVLACFQMCMGFSAIYHTFSCRSARDFNNFLSLDLFGIALSLLAIYTSGIFYAFWCLQDLQNFYLISVTLIFVAAMIIQIPKFEVHSNVKTLVFIAWAAYGVVPTLHWSYIMGGFENPVVALLVPRVLGMYFISGLAFSIYILKVPERFFIGKFNYLGHSHNWWHLLVTLALYYWHNTGIMYVEYRMNHACANNMRLP